ncbi:MULTISPECIES: ATP-binding protein [Cyanophyceae]|uniref:ATP-binding protein n=1 Tax=Cyanophyceae TaxID=3028117 RepID=UPI000A99DEB7|nr:MULTISPECIES: ATP-binding protein [Cyanophyceae]MDB9357827.1 ATP-binding protein [Nodularia spumigena CS-587/03]MDB9319027.1 ATP-binding protein [Nodularia spumigena CS-590/01A]MDB9321498.1 ATP-binding protein [Nodularia spumigena CS-591/07A]MDB9324641.1 ATP-binding protein [Nodularia spumigena CS-590/02]MDB9328981.1 ATP-binding protein [Nodularia spumigena CS-591/04]
MNSQPKSPTSNHPRGQPREFEQIIHEKSHNFVGRDFVFTAIDEFIHRYNRGYFTIIGAPGSGKSAILAKYAIDHPHVVVSFLSREWGDKKITPLSLLGRSWGRGQI